MRPMTQQPFAPTMIAGAATFLVGILGAVQAFAMTMTVPESAIISLANAPALQSFDGAVDEAARPSLLFELEFPNDCYAAAGAKLLLLRGTADQPTSVLIVEQRFPDEGCPDIFQPVRTSLRALLPPDLANQTVSILARPAPQEVIRSIRLERRPIRAPGDVIVQEIAASPGEVAPQVFAPAVRSSGSVGYDLTGELRLAEGCHEADLRVRVFEVPDAQGTPSSDAVLVTIPPRCATSEPGERSDLSIRIQTPQPASGRRVLLLNALPARPLPLSP